MVYPLKPLEDALTVMMDRHRLDLLTASGRMRDLINRKWSSFALRLFNWRLIRFVACLVAFQVSVFIGPNRSLYLNDDDDSGQSSITNGDWGGFLFMSSLMKIDYLTLLQMVCEMFVLFATGLKFSTEFEELMEYGWKAHFLRSYFALHITSISS